MQSNTGFTSSNLGGVNTGRQDLGLQGSTGVSGQATAASKAHATEFHREQAKVVDMGTETVRDRVTFDIVREVPKTVIMPEIGRVHSETVRAEAVTAPTGVKGGESSGMSAMAGAAEQICVPGTTGRTGEFTQKTQSTTTTSSTLGSSSLGGSSLLNKPTDPRL